MGELTSHQAPSIFAHGQIYMFRNLGSNGSNRFGRVTEFKIFLGPSLSRIVIRAQGLAPGGRNFLAGAYM